MEQIIRDLRETLKANIDEKTQKTGQSYFKEKVISYGVKVITVSKISKDLFSEIKHQPKHKIFSLCEELWQSGYLEESFIAAKWSDYISNRYEPNDFAIFDKWVNLYITNWASCDTLCNHSIGTFVEMYPQYTSELKKWAKSNNRWVKRAAAVTLIIPARKGLFLDDIFEIADILLLDKDDLVQKGYGWMLKAASEAHQEKVFEYVISKKKIIPRTALRYAIEKMPLDLKSEAMKK
ncbi:DNA alkylation repair protein [Dysgonomonas sp. Marseille-P4677]|uniref:DNA alkylation repair protein n=1 Tax=Dysgonomonas sp. Marseille-P4677 TaxID=2364790 RepID=UPI0019144BF3|nr:DNA alkylation repair protein [Dysgonomonas sp. Marseille-P4677]MBK5721549.1 DNA alkylation repair protein [Dysgonomonas sp. Marseille-P4677]